ELLEVQQGLARVRPDDDPDAIRRRLSAGVDVYQRHAPLLRAGPEAGAGGGQIAAGHAALRRQFDELVADSLRRFADLARTPVTDVAETARALNRMNETYLLAGFGREPRVSPETAVQTLTEIWDAVIHR